MSVKMHMQGPGPVPAHGYGVSDKRGDLRPAPANANQPVGMQVNRQGDKVTIKHQMRNPYVNDN